MGQLSRYTDPAGRTTDYFYDGLSQVRKKVDPCGQTFEYLYDEERNLVGLVNEKGERYQLKYDKNERLIEEVGFDGRVQQYRYNARGHLIARIEGRHAFPQDQNNHTTHFKRDALGRLLEQISPDGDSARFGYNAAGQLTSAINAHRELRLTYNANGRLTREQQDKHVLEHRYDAFGNLIETILPDKRKISYRYNAEQLWTSIDFNGHSIVKLTRDHWGREIRRQQGPLISDCDYDLMGRLNRHRVTLDQTKVRLIQRDYHYDKAGNLSGIDDVKKGATQFRYDALDRLRDVNGYCQEQFYFDPAGNLLGDSEESVGGVASAVAGAQVKGNRLQFQGDRKFTYDSAGNLTKENRGSEGKLETHYQYNSQNQLVGVVKGKQVVRYYYDALGDVLRKRIISAKPSSYGMAMCS